MATPGREAPLDYLTLGESLAALAYPVRLALLDKLRFPQQLKDIRLTPHRVSRDASPDRPVARQTLQTHLRILVEQGLVLKDAAAADGTAATSLYVANPTRLYGILEDLRRLSLRHAGTGAAASETGTIGAHPRAKEITGPRLVLVHGVYEGKVFPLTPESATDGAWTIGRAKGLPVPLDYDPFVSSRNSVLERIEDGFRVRDLPGNKNGTSVNWAPLERGGSRSLKSGDVVGVGRSLLVFVGS